MTSFQRSVARAESGGRFLTTTGYLRQCLEIFGSAKSRASAEASGAALPMGPTSVLA